MDTILSCNNALRLRWQHISTRQGRPTNVSPVRVSANLNFFIRAGRFNDSQYYKQLSLYKKRLSVVTLSPTRVSKVRRVKIRGEVLVLKRAVKQNLKISLKSYFPRRLKLDLISLVTLYDLVGKHLRAHYKLEMGFLPSLRRSATVLELRLVNPDLLSTFFKNGLLNPSRRNYVVVIEIVHTDSWFIDLVAYVLRGYFYSDEAA